MFWSIFFSIMFFLATLSFFFNAKAGLLRMKANHTIFLYIMKNIKSIDDYDNLWQNPYETMTYSFAYIYFHPWIKSGIKPEYREMLETTAIPIK